MGRDSRRRSGQGERFQCAGCSSPSFGPLGVLDISTRRRSDIAGGLVFQLPFNLISITLLRSNSQTFSLHQTTPLKNRLTLQCLDDQGRGGWDDGNGCLSVLDGELDSDS
jgi:hypothetical protein